MAKTVGCCQLLVIVFTMLVLFGILTLCSSAKTTSIIQNEAAEPNPCMNVSDGNQGIPKIIHRIRLDDHSQDVSFFGAREYFEEEHFSNYPDFKYVIWNSSMIEALINESFPDMRHVFQTKHVNTRLLVQLARYMVIHSMGGVFMEWGIDIFPILDIACLNHMFAANQALFAYTENPLRINSQFFMAPKGHAFIAHALTGIQDVDLFHPKTFIFYETATESETFLMERYISYTNKHEVSFRLILSGFQDAEQYRLQGQFAIEFNEFVTITSSTSIAIIQLITLVLIVVILVQIMSIEEMYISINKVVTRRAKHATRASMQWMDTSKSYENV